MVFILATQSAFGRKNPGKKPMQVLEAGLSRLVRELQGSCHVNHVLENFDLAGSSYILQEGAQPEWGSLMVKAKDRAPLDGIKE